MYVYAPPSWSSLHPHPLGLHSTPDWAASAIEHVPTSYLSYIWQCICLGAQSCPIFATACAVALEAPLFMGFLRQEYHSRLPFPPPGDLPDSGIKPVSPALQAILYHRAIREAHGSVYMSALISHSSHPPSHPLCPQVHSLCLYRCSCPADRAICTIFCSPRGRKESDMTWWLNNNIADSLHVEQKLM